MIGGRAAPEVRVAPDAHVRPEVRVATPAVLGRAHRAALPTMRSAVLGLHPSMRRIISYHLGWTDADGRAVDANAGKAVRAALAVLGAEAAGADDRLAAAGAAAVELLHNFTLLHDDIMDGDTTRRHRVAAWALFGTGRALLAGDALLVRSIELLQDVAGPTGPTAARLLTRTATALVSGQADDVDFVDGSAVGSNAVTLADYRRMSAGKTGTLLGCSTAIGPVLAGSPLRVTAALQRFGSLLGQAFQAVDDVLGIWGRPAVTGKPTWSDLREGKKSLPILVALQAGTPAAADLAALLAAGPHTEEDLRRAADLVEAGGGRAAAEEEARECVREAEDVLAGVPMPDHTRTELLSLARYLVDRER